MNNNNSLQFRKAIMNLGLLFLFFFISNYAFGQTTKDRLDSFYAWLKPIVNVILAIVTILAVCRAVYKTFFKHQEAGFEWGFVLIGIVLWGLWITFATEIISMMGGTPYKF